MPHISLRIKTIEIIRLETLQTLFLVTIKMRKIAMTSPVVIKLHNENEMAFIMPNKYDIISLPKPKNTDINIYTVKHESCNNIFWVY